MLIAVVGAGNGGQASAAHLTLSGHRVRLFDRFPEVTEPFAASRRLVIAGAVSGEATVDAVTNDIALALGGAELVLVTLPGFGLEWAAAAMAPHLEDGQVVVLHPGGTGGALEVRRVWQAAGMGAEVALAETSTLVYACRLSAPGRPDVKAIKRAVSIAALPAEGLAPALERFAALYPQVTPAGSVLATGLANMNAVIHPAVALLNAGLIDRAAPGFDFYGQGVTDGVARVVLAVDAERLAIAAAYGVASDPLTAWVASAYGVRADRPSVLFARLAETIYQGIGTPESLEGRYISEDVPLALVPMEELATVAGVETPAMSAIVTLCSALNRTDYRREGRTLARLGLDGMGVDEIAARVGAPAPHEPVRRP